MTGIGLNFATLRAAYAAGTLTPSAVVDVVYDRVQARGDDHVWLHLLPREAALRRARDIERRKAAGEALPLYGLPDGVKDNIDIAGLPTTAGCAAFAYVPQHSAAVAERLDAAGALLIGKQNLDQFATGLVGIRSPGGFCRNAFSDDDVPVNRDPARPSLCGGLGVILDRFRHRRLGPGADGLQQHRRAQAHAGHRQHLWLRPLPPQLRCRARVRAHGGRRLRRAVGAVGPDPRDAYSRAEALLPAAASPPRHFVFGVPLAQQREFFGDVLAERQYGRALDHLQVLGGVPHPVDLAPFLEAGALLFGSALVPERRLRYGASAWARRCCSWPRS